MITAEAALPLWLKGVQVDTATVPAMLHGATAHGVLWQACPGRFLLEVPEVARYLVEDGARITVEPMPVATEGDVRRFLRLTPLAALLFQRGILALHATAVVHPGNRGQSFCGRTGDGTIAEGPAPDPRPPTPKAVVIAGQSGAGKSSLLAALLGRGWPTLGDELVAVDLDESGRPQVLPMYAEVRLWPDAMKNLGLIDSDEPASHLDRTPKPVLPFPPLYGSALPLGALHALEVHSRDDVLTVSLVGAGRFDIVGALLYNTRIADALMDRRRYLALAAAVAHAVPMQRLIRPRRRWSVEELADQISRAYE